MKIEITRRELIKLASFAKLSNLAWDKRAFYLETALAEKGLDTATPAGGNEMLRKSIEVAMRDYRSDYLVDLVYAYTHQEYQVVGKERSLKACPCCCYKTLKKGGSTLYVKCVFGRMMEWYRRMITVVSIE